MDKTRHARTLETLITPCAEGMGFEIVRVLLIGTGRPVLQVMAERNDGSGAITLDECARLSQALSAVLDVEGAMGDGAYTLEVSSPGIDRPLTRPKDFSRYAGQAARLETASMVDGRRRFRGILRGMADGMVRIETEDGEAAIPFAAIEKAKLAFDEDKVQPRQKRKKF